MQKIEISNDVADYRLSYEILCFHDGAPEVNDFYLEEVWTTDQDGEDVQVKDSQIISSLDTDTNRERACEIYNG